MIEKDMIEKDFYNFVSQLEAKKKKTSMTRSHMQLHEILSGSLNCFCPRDLLKQ